MSISSKDTDRLLRRVLLAVARLPADDLPLVADFVESLSAVGTTSGPQPSEILADARRRADQIKDLPRAELMERFTRAAKLVRDEAAAAGAVIDESDNV